MSWLTSATSLIVINHYVHHSFKLWDIVSFQKPLKCEYMLLKNSFWFWTVGQMGQGNFRHFINQKTKRRLTHCRAPISKLFNALKQWLSDEEQVCVKCHWYFCILSFYMIIVFILHPKKKNILIHFSIASRTAEHEWSDQIYSAHSEFKLICVCFYKLYMDW